MANLPVPPGGDSLDISQDVGINDRGNIFGTVTINNGDLHINTSAPEGGDSKSPSGPVRPTLPERARIFLSYKRDISPDDAVAEALYHALQPQHQVFIDKAMPIGTRWAEQIQQEIFQADVLIVLLSEAATYSEMVCEEVAQAHVSASRRQGLPVIMPVRLNYDAPYPKPLTRYLDPLQWAMWKTPADTPRLIAQIQQAIAGQPLPVEIVTPEQQAPKKTAQPPAVADVAELTMPMPSAQSGRWGAGKVTLEKPEGTMRPDSGLYISRLEDDIALETIKQQGIIITIKGARQMGKSSLLIRVMDEAAKLGKQVVYLDFQMFDQAMLQNSDAFFQQFCTMLTEELDLEDCVLDYWQRPQEGNRQRCTRYMRKHILQQLGDSLVLAMDEVESIFGAPFRTDFFGMLRSWNNRGAGNPLWRKLDLALVTSTEPYQLIDDLNQSPFNVGEVLDLRDFTREQVAQLNQLHGSPLNPGEVAQLVKLVNGHPYLTRRALYLIARGQMGMESLLQQAADDRGPFGDHLRHHLFRLHNKPELKSTLLQVIRNQTCQDEQIFFRLRGAGLIRRRETAVVPRCQLYADYFRKYSHG